MKTEKSAWKNVLIKTVVFLLVVIVLLVAWRISVQHQENRSEKKAEMLMRNSRFEEAELILVNLRYRTGSLVRKERLRLKLADCYLELARKPENEGDRSLGYYAKLSMIAPERVPDSIRVQLNKKH